MTTLTARQAEVLDGVKRAGGIALHLQTGRTQAVIRNLISKGYLTIATDGRIAAREPQHYGHSAVMAASVDIGQGWRRASITLADGDTLWNPYSTKKHLAGAGEWKFLIHPSGIEVEVMPDLYYTVGIPR